MHALHLALALILTITPTLTLTPTQGLLQNFSFVLKFYTYNNSDT